MSENLHTNNEIPTQYTLKTSKIDSKNCLTLDFGSGEDFTPLDNGEVRSLLINNINYELINDAVKRGLLCVIYINTEPRFFSNRGNSVVRKILDGTYGPIINNVNDKIENENMPTFSLKIRTSKEKLDRERSPQRHDSINSLELTVEIPGIKSHVVIYGGKIEMIIDDSEKSDETKIRERLESQLIVLKERGVICDIPYFIVSKEDLPFLLFRSTPSDDARIRYSLKLPEVLNISVEERNKLPKMQTVINVGHPEITTIISSMYFIPN